MLNECLLYCPGVKQFLYYVEDLKALAVSGLLWPQPQMDVSNHDRAFLVCHMPLQLHNTFF